MGTDTFAASAPPPAASQRVPDARGAPVERRIAAAILALLPGILVLYFGFNGGGFFPGTVAFACVIVIQLVIVRVLLADDPFDGFNARVAIVGGLLTGFAAWVLLSGLWANARDRTLIEFDRALLYLLVFALFALAARSQRRIPWMVRGAVAAGLICCSVGLVSRVLPDAIPTTVTIAANRLSYPLTYWNALGLLAGVTLLLLLGLSASRGELRIVRAAACAAAPIAATTLYFTFSRGAILAVAVAAVVFLVTARSAFLPATLLAALPPTLVALIAAYHADALASNRPQSPHAVDQGHELVPVLVGCVIAAGVLRVLLIPLDDRLAAVKRTPARVRAGRAALAATAAVALVVALAAGGPHWISKEYHGFFQEPKKSAQTDLRARLTDPSSNGRVAHWKAALEEFHAQPLHGGGAGTYEFAWYEHRTLPITVVDAHGLYVEVLGELGIVGLVLIAGTVVGLLVGIGRHTRRRAGGPNRVLYAAVLAAAAAWAVQAGVDWLWEMPVVTAPVFAFAGAALASRRAAGAPPPPTPVAQRSRVPLAAALIVIAALPALILFSQSRLQDSAQAFARGDCKRAYNQAFASLNQLSVRPEAYRIIGYCDVEQGRPEEAIAAMQKALQWSGRNWESHYGASIALAAAGRDPRAEIQQTVRMNPLEPFVRSTEKAFDSDKPSVWRRAAVEQMRVALDSRQLTFR